MRKTSSQKNPLVTTRRWEHEAKEQQLNSIEQLSEGGNDSIVVRNQRTSVTKKQPIAPTETDRQEMSFTHMGQKIAENKNLPPTSQHLKSKQSSKSFNVESVKRGNSVKKVDNSYGEQV